MKVLLLTAEDFLGHPSNALGSLEQYILMHWGQFGSGSQTRTLYLEDMWPTLSRLFWSPRNKHFSFIFSDYKLVPLYDKNILGNDRFLERRK